MSDDRTMLLPLVTDPLPELKQGLRAQLDGMFMLGGHTVAVINGGPETAWLEISISSRGPWMPLGAVTHLDTENARVTLARVLDHSGRRILAPSSTTRDDVLARVRHVRERSEAVYGPESTSAVPQAKRAE